MKNTTLNVYLFIGFSLVLGYFFWLANSLAKDLESQLTLTETVDTVCTDIVIYDTIKVYTESSLPRQEAWKGSTWTDQEKIEFCKFINTQQMIPGDDQWAVIQVMLNICKAGGWTWTKYSYEKHHEGTFFDRCRAGLQWNYRYNPDNPNDAEIMKRLNLALAGKIPEMYRIPDNIIAFESHPPQWNANVTRGLWQRSMIGLTLVHEFYYDWSKVTPKERTLWSDRLRDWEYKYKIENG
jgi:hypothetical protein